MGSTLKGKNLLLKEQILSFQSRPHFVKAWSASDANRSHSYFPLKNGKMHIGIPLHIFYASEIMFRISQYGIFWGPSIEPSK